MTNLDMYKDALHNLTLAIWESGLAAEIDCGCDGNGAFAKALVLLGEYATLEEANEAIFEDEEEEEEEEEEDSDD